MAALNPYEFECPQFVDFTSGLEGSPKEDLFGLPSPGIRNLAEFKVPKNVPKPKSKTHFSSSLKKSTTVEESKEFLVNIVQSTNITDSAKLSSRKLLSKRLSKSDGAINLVPDGKQMAKKKVGFFPGFKRSLSESDLRSKKKIYATTPLCLKRTNHNLKSRKIKTSEELELEKISQLQKQMIEHLRANETAMKRQKLKQARLTGTAMKAKTVPVKGIHHDHKTVLEKINNYAKRAESQIQKEVVTKESSSRNAETLKRINNLKKSGSCSSNLFFQNFLNPLVPHQISETTFAKEGIHAVLNHLPIQKADAHRGLMFSTSQRKPAIRTFNFQDTVRDLNSNTKCENKIKHKDQPACSMQTPRLIKKNKENISAMKGSHSIVKSGKLRFENKMESRY